jgi:hypothetical protein
MPIIDTPPISQLSQVISQAIAPAFILGSVSGFIAVLVTRLNRIIDRCRSLAAQSQTQGPGDPAQGDLKRPNTRADLINRALLFAVACALVTILLMIVAFGYAFLGIAHEKGVALLFATALALFGVSLVNFAREIRIALNDPNNFD